MMSSKACSLLAVLLTAGFGLLPGTGRAQESAATVPVERRLPPGLDVPPVTDVTREDAAAGRWDAQLHLGLYLAREGKELDEAVRLIVAAARQGSPLAFATLGWLHRVGHGVTADVDLALDLFERAVTLGLPAPAAEMSLVLFAPDEHRDPARAIRVLELAAEHGSDHAAMLLAYGYLRGTYMPGDDALGAQWMSRAAEKRVVAALWLAELHEKGIGIERDAAEAAVVRAAALRKATLAEKSEFANGLSSMGRDDLRNGDLAIRLLEPELADPNNRTALALSSLATAYAAVGRFDDAVATQVAALDELALTQGVSSLAKREFEDRLNLFRSGKPYRQPDL